MGVIAWSNRAIWKSLSTICKKSERDIPDNRTRHRSFVERSRYSVKRLFTIWVMLCAVVCSMPVGVSNLPVRYREGLTHGFLVLSTTDGDPIAVGDLNEVARGNRVTARLVYHFKDGSLQDETTVFSQHRTFSLLSYHLIQKGPAFPHPTEVSFDTSSGQVNVQYIDDKGNEKTENERLKLPSDLANGLVLTLLKNIRPGEALPQVSMLVATPKPRIVKLSLSLQGKEPFTLVGSRREALHYVIKVDIGGLAGLVAPLLGKQPPDSHVWIIGGEAPTFVKSETLSYLGGPMWRTELVAPVWPKTDAEPKGESPKNESKEKR